MAVVCRYIDHWQQRRAQLPSENARIHTHGRLARAAIRYVHLFDIVQLIDSILRVVFFGCVVWVIDRQCDVSRARGWERTDGGPVGWQQGQRCELLASGQREKVCRCLRLDVRFSLSLLTVRVHAVHTARGVISPVLAGCLLAMWLQ